MQHVILLHGMGRSSLSMFTIKKHLERFEYKVINLNYPSTKYTVQQISEKYLSPLIAELTTKKTSKIHIVTHSLGGIITRHFLRSNQLPNGSKIVMLAPPNKGSEICDALKNTFFYRWTTGPAGQQLSTQENSFVNQLKAINTNTKVGIIAGNRSIEPWFSHLFSGEHDGKVSVENTKLDEMQDFIVLPYTHTFLMQAPKVHHQIEYFLRNGVFNMCST